MHASRAAHGAGVVLPLEDFVLGRLSDTELVIDPRRVKELAARLESRGMTPLVKKA